MRSQKPILIKDGIRIDGRKPDQLRPIRIKLGVLKHADGSCYFEMGNNKILAAVYGPRELHPRHEQDPTKAILRYRYNMAPFSVEERKRPGPDRRSIELSKVSRQALEPLVIKELFPRTAIDVFVEILEADAGTRTAGINAACLAIASAGIPMTGLVGACAVGKVDGWIVLDLCREEDQYGEADMPIAFTSSGKLTLLQMDGVLSSQEFAQALELGIRGCQQILELERKSLLDLCRRKLEPLADRGDEAQHRIG